jgi:hypothetical protein
MRIQELSQQTYQLLLHTYVLITGFGVGKKIENFAYSEKLGEFLLRQISPTKNVR